MIKQATVTNPLDIDEQIVLNIMDKLDEKIVEEFMHEYIVDEYEARKSLAEMYYINQYI